jgi:DNA-binding NarL/FixJ family response regulator
MTVVILTVDLSVVSLVDGAAARIGEKARAVANESDAVSQCIAGNSRTLVVDLSMPSLNVASLVKQLNSAMPIPPRVIAFGPHVDAARLEGARNAGCDGVMSRGHFFSRIDDVLQPG